MIEYRCLTCDTTILVGHRKPLSETKNILHFSLSTDLKENLCVGECEVVS